MNLQRLIVAAKVYLDRITRDSLPPGVFAHRWPAMGVGWMRTANDRTGVSAWEKFYPGGEQRTADVLDGVTVSETVALGPAY